MKSIRRNFLFAAALLALASVAMAQAYPSKPIKLIWPYAPGGPGDAIARLLATSMSASLGQQVIVENRTGASGSIGAVAVQRSPADGYTLLLNTITTNVQVPLVTKDPSFDPVKSLTPVINVGSNPLAILVNPSLPVTDFPSFIAWAKQQPNGVDVAVAGPTLEVASALLSQQAGIKLVNIPFRGNAPALQAVLAGDVKVYYNTPSGTLLQHLKDGKLRLIAVASAEPSVLLPGAAPIAKFIPGYVQDINYAIWGPAGMPSAIVSRVGEAVRKAMAEPGMAEKFLQNGVAPALAGPEEVTRITQREAANIKRIMETTPVKFGE
jgi:tripartite-type tricarboxylate transporter receptor subunit TctC